MQLVDLLERYAARKLLKSKTRNLHAIGIRQFSRMLVKHAEVADLTDANLALFAERRLGTKRAAATVSSAQSKLLALWRFAAREGLVAKWPTVRPVRIPHRVPRAWTMEELGKLFAATVHAQPVAGVPGAVWWRALFFVLFDTAERIEAAMSITWEGVDLEGLTILIPAEVRKGQTADRLYPIAEDTAEWLAKIPCEHKGPFFWPYCTETLYNRLKRMLVKANLPADRRSKFHRIRRTTASYYQAAGGDAMELLGHTSRKVTRGYLDPRIVKTPSAVDLLQRPTG